MTSWEDLVLAQVDAQIDALDTPTSEEVFAELTEFSADHKVAAAISLAKAGGGGGGGASVLKVATFTLTAADILGLNATPVELVAAPAAGKTLVPLTIVATSTFLTPYTGGGALTYLIGPDWTQDAIALDGTIMSPDSADTIGYDTVFFQTGAYGAPPPAELALTISAEIAYTDGTTTVQGSVFYVEHAL